MGRGPRPSVQACGRLARGAGGRCERPHSWREAGPTACVFFSFSFFAFQGGSMSGGREGWVYLRTPSAHIQC